MLWIGWDYLGKVFIYLEDSPVLCSGISQYLGKGEETKKGQARPSWRTVFVLKAKRKKFSKKGLGSWIRCCWEESTLRTEEAYTGSSNEIIGAPTRADSVTA